MRMREGRKMKLRMLFFSMIIVSCSYFLGACASTQKIKKENSQLKIKNQELAVELESLREKEQRLKEQEQKIIEIDAERLALIESGKERDERLKTYEKIFAQLKQQIISDKFKVRFKGDKLILALSSDLLFHSGAAEVTKEGLKTLEEIAQILRGVADRSFQIEGHTDDVPISSKKYPSNWELASARALAVLHILREGGVKEELLSAASYSNFRPLHSNQNAKGRALNRRVEIALIPDLSVIPPEFFQSYRRTKAYKKL